MKRIGGPLLSVGDLLHDLSEDGADSFRHVPSSPALDSGSSFPPAHLPHLFQETYDQLTASLAGGSDNSWPELTFKLCSAVETADKLNSLALENAEALLGKVDSLATMTKRCHSVVEAAKDLTAVVNKGDVEDR
ncbi:histone-lysine N-methyltransferase [Wolffia australiana]